MSDTVMNQKNEWPKDFLGNESNEQGLTTHAMYKTISPSPNVVNRRRTSLYNDGKLCNSGDENGRCTDR